MLPLVDRTLESHFIEIFVKTFLISFHLFQLTVSFVYFTILKHKSLPKQKTAIAQLANLTGRTLPTTVEFSFWKNSGLFLIETIFAYRVTTKLTKVHILLLLERNKLARVAIRIFYFQLRRPRHHKYVLREAEIKRLLTDSELSKSRSNNLFLLVQDLVLQIHRFVCVQQRRVKTFSPCH